MIRAAADRLLAGDPVDAVMADLRARCPALSSLNSVLSRVRTEVLDRNVRPAEYDDAPLRPYLDAPFGAEVRAILNAPAREQRRIQSEHRARPTWPAEAEAALQALCLLPAAMDAFRLSRDDVVSLKRKREASLLRKHERLIVVSDATQLLQTARQMLESASPAHSIARLALPLLLVSGRRETELLNGRSTFLPMPREHAACFDGQLKKRGAGEAFEIPLLVPYSTFANGLRALREKQGAQIATLDDKQVSALYNANLRRDLTRALPGAPEGIHPHDLRSVYVALVYELFESPYTLARTAMAILGHTQLGESLSYSNVRVHNAQRGVLGAL
jgi:hypothetical protein